MAAERETAIAPDYDFDFGDLSGFTEELGDTSIKPIENQPETPPVKEEEEKKPSILDFIKEDEDKEDKTEKTEDKPIVETTPVVETTDKEEEEVSSSDTDEKDITKIYGEDADATAVGIFEVMKEKGYVTDDIEFKGNFESLDDIFEELPDAIFKSVFQQFPKPMQNLLRFAYAKGDKVSWNEISSYVEEFTPFDASKVKIESAEEQRDFLKKQLVSQGQDAEDAEILLDKWEDDGKLEAKSKSLLDKLKESDKSKTDKKVNETEAEKTVRLANKRKFVHTIRQTASEVGYSKSRQQHVLESIFQGNINTISKKIHQHPKAFVKLANYLSYFDEKTGDINEEDFKKQAFSSTTRQVQSNLQKHFGKTAKAKKVVPKTKDSKVEFEFVT